MVYMIWSNQFGYSKFNEKFRLSTVQKVPKVIHYCWFGRKEIQNNIGDGWKSGKILFELSN